MVLSNKKPSASKSLMRGRIANWLPVLDEFRNWCMTEEVKRVYQETAEILIQPINFLGKDALFLNIP